MLPDGCSMSRFLWPPCIGVQYVGVWFLQLLAVPAIPTCLLAESCTLALHTVACSHWFAQFMVASTPPRPLPLWAQCQGLMSL